MVKQWISWQQIGLGLLGSVLTMPLALAQNVQIIPAPNGTGTIVEVNGKQFNISGGAFSGDGRNLFHLFREFGLNNGQIANFLANPQLRNILAGVNGGNPSVINGLLQVTGGNPNLYLINPAGIIFGANAQLNVPATFAATTATGVEFRGGWFSLNGTNNFQNLGGNPIGFAFTGNQAGSIVNEGNLSVNPGQSLLLLGGNVVNTGNLSAPGGEITVAAVPGQSLVRISQAGQLLSLDVRTPQPGDSLPHDWQLPILSLPELLTGPGAAHVNQVSVNPDGSIRLGSKNIWATPGLVGITGDLNTSSNLNSTQVGGSITVVGNSIDLIGATLRANGPLGGGTIRIGGDYQGSATLPQAQFVNVDGNSLIAANALNTGDGGRVILWSQDQTRFNGQITARGGTLGGDGGFIETSSKNILSILGGSVDAGANLGAAGTWLLDPTAITIVASGGGAIGTSVVDVGLINSALNSNTNVTLNTNIDISGGDILQNADAKINHTANNQPTLSMIASGAITLLGGINSSFSGLNVSLSAGDSAGGPVDPNVSHQISIAGPQQLTMRTLTTKTDAWTQLQQSIKTRGDQTYNSFVSIAPDSNATVPFTLESTTGSLIFNDQLSMTSNLVALVANNFQFNGGDDSITGPGGTIALATNGLFTVNQGLINTFADGFNLIGLASQSSQVRLSSDIAVTDPLRILAPQINTQGFNISGTDNASLILQGPGGVTANGLTTANGSIIVSTSSSQTNPAVSLLPSPISLGSVNSGNSPLALLTTGTLATGSLDTSGTLTLQATNGITLNGQVGGSLAPISLVALGPTTIRESITTSGNQLYTGSVTINASSPTTATNPLTLTSQNGILSFGNTLAAGGNYLELFANGADALIFNGGPGSVSGSKGIIFASNNSLVVNQSILAPLADGFEFIALASRAPDSTAVVLTSDITVNDPLILFGPAINTQGHAINAVDNASVTLQGFGTNGVVTGNITTQGQPITISTSNDFANPLTSLSFALINTTGGTLTANGSTIQIVTNGNINTGSLTNTFDDGMISLTGFDVDTTSGILTSPTANARVEINAVNNISIGAITPAAQGISGEGEFRAQSQNGTINLLNASDFGFSGVTLTAPVGISTSQTISTRGQAINLTSISGDINTPGLVSNGGAINLNNAAGDIVIGLITSGGGNVAITNGTGAVNTGLLTSQDGSINIATESGAITLGGINTFSGAVNLTSGTGEINTGNLSSTSGTIQASTGRNLTTGTIDTPGSVTLTGLEVTVGAIGETLIPSLLSITSGANTTTITGNITTIGNQTYTGPVVLNPATPTSLQIPLSLSSQAGDIIFSSSLNVGNHNLLLDANGSNPFQFNGGTNSVTATGGTLALLTENSLSLNQAFLNPFSTGFSTLAINSAPSSPSGGGISLTDNLTSANPLRLFAPSINSNGFNITGLGGASLTLQGQAITVNALSTETGGIIVSTSPGLDPTTNLQVGPIQTGAISSTNGNISLLTAGTLISGALNTNGNIILTGNQGITLGAVGNSATPDTLTTTGLTTVTQNIAVDNNLLFNNNVIVSDATPSTPLQLDANTITFNGAVNTGSGDVVVLGDTILATGGPGSVSGTGSLTVGTQGALTINSSNFLPLADGFRLIVLGTGGGITLASNLSFSDPVVFGTLGNINTQGFNLVGTDNSSITLRTFASAIDLAQILAGGITLENIAAVPSGSGSIQTNTISTNGQLINIATNGSITTGRLTSQGGAIGLGTTTTTGAITTGPLNAGSGSIQALTSGILSTGAIDTSGAVTLQGADVFVNGAIGNLLSPNLLNVTATASDTIFIGGNITTSGNQIFNGNVVLTSATNLLANAGTITFNGNLNGAFPISFTGSQFNINGTIGEITPLTSIVGTGSTTLAGNVFTSGNQTFNSPLIAISSSTTFQSTGGNLNFNNITTNGGNLRLLAAGSLVTGSLMTNNFAGAAGNINLQGATIDTTAGIISATSPTQQGTITMQAPGNINLGFILTRSDGTGATVTVISQNGSINALNGIDLGTNQGVGSQLTLQAGSDINLAGTFYADAGTRDAGQIRLTSGGSISGSTAQLIASATTSFGLSGTPSGNGGLVSATATGNINLATISAFADAGDGGTVTLNGQTIEVESIDAQGSTQGGTVNIMAGPRFQATDTFIDQDGINASISAAGGTGNGNIRIQINSAAPFVVGGSSENGTVGAITTGTNNTISEQTFPASATVGNFELITLGTPTPIPSPTPSPTPSLTPEQKQQASVVLQGQENSQSTLSLVNPPPLTLINRDFAIEVSLIEELQCQTFSNYFGRSLCQRPQSLEEVKGILAKIANQTGKNPGVIYVLSRPQQVELLLVTGGQEPIRHVIPGVTQAQLSELAQQFSNQVRDPRFIGTNAYLSNAQKLYQILIQPLQTDLQAQKVDTLLFSLDTGLRTIPLAALHNGQRFLVEEYALGLVPSMTMIDPTYRDIRQDKILAMGADTFSDLSPLPAVPVELATITQDLGGGVKFLNQDFTVRRLEAERRREDFAVVHLATHGEFNPGSVKDSFIAFSDRRVNLEQMRRLRLNLPTTDLLTLSACRTAVGDEQAELGFAGLAVQSGIKTALASLWYVSDEGTLGLMTEFYQQLGQAPIKAEALRQAQLAMIRGQVTIKDGELISANRPNPIKLPPGLANVPNRALNHPYYWAAFTMIGSPW
ncbi:CHAT domain-containing protein [Thermosynechococcaceae cyanobacterium BACA0444]|uniref:CHAT domain-containing protein n=1 Tax=Pseudocalidococcus azoricus BACA0444 TaxID=2918990 RepID=A0AAE4JZ82_9CYAN|nr:CHAT domain-containing protein [Pseudocalidococcus azoricus]MDS3861809.1 CHAT domain-containing protein [Pseudocalidococcus azoricus BACA0444]